MKQLLLLRHAKSDWNNIDLSDFDRPLAPRGLKDAPLMGQMAKSLDVVPDKIISSPALRAKETVELFSRAAGFGGEIIYEKKLYAGSPEIYRKVVSMHSGTGILMLVGHNPVMEEFLGMICTGHNTIPAIMPTSGFACVDIDNPAIKEIYPGSGHLKWFLAPGIIRKITGSPGTVS